MGRKIKVIRRPLTDVYGRDIMTGKVVESDFVIDWKEQKKKADKFVAGKEVIDGKIYVEGLGMVSI